MHQTTYTGSYFDGQTPERHAVTVAATHDGLRVTWMDGVTEVWSYESVRQSQGARRGEPARFERGKQPAEVLVVEDATILEAIHAASPVDARRFVTPERRRRRVRMALGLGLVGVAAAVATYLKGVPALAEYLAVRIPVSWERQLGAKVVSQLTEESAVCGDTVVEASVTRIVQRLADGSPSPYDWDVKVVRAEAVNAFAAPGGFIVVHSGLLERSERPEELAGVLAHEMQHVLNRHGTKALLRQVPIRLFMSAVTGDASVFGTAVEAVGTVGLLRYQRRDEEEADRDGLALLRTARIDPAGMVGFFETLEQEAGDVPGILTYLSTHPNTASRIAALEELLAAEPPTAPQPLLADVDWQLARAACSVPAEG